MAGLAFSDVTFSYASGLLRPHRQDVFDRFSWRVQGGRTVLLGPNGAGKTTLLALGATALAPKSGRVALGALDAGKRGDRQAIRRAIGWMPQQTRPIPGLTAREQVAYGGWLKGLSRSEAWQEAHAALDRVGLGEEEDRLTVQLSGGQQRRVGLAQCLVHKAEVLLLDEPSAGLDPTQRARFREILLEVSGDAGVVVSTHQVDDIADLFDRVVVLDRGLIRFDGPIAEFTALAPASSAFRIEAAYASLVEAER